jgi:hypothetical protein
VFLVSTSAAFAGVAFALAGIVSVSSLPSRAAVSAWPEVAVLPPRGFSRNIEEVPCAQFSTRVPAAGDVAAVTVADGLVGVVEELVADVEVEFAVVVGAVIELVVVAVVDGRGARGVRGARPAPRARAVREIRAMAPVAAARSRRAAAEVVRADPRTTGAPTAPVAAPIRVTTVAPTTRRAMETFRIRSGDMRDSLISLGQSRLKAIARPS